MKLFIAFFILLLLFAIMAIYHSKLSIEYIVKCIKDQKIIDKKGA